MKTLARHLLFWGFYFVQSLLLIFLVNAARFAQPLPAQLLPAAEHCLLLLLPKLFFTYILLRSRIAAGAKAQGRSIVFIALALVASVALYRFLMFAVIEPFVYHWQSGLPYFYALGFLVALMDIGFVAAAALAIKQARAQRALKERAQSLLREKLESELRFLRSQTNPHFLFNTLNNIYALARKKSDQTPEVVLRLSKLLRFMLYESARPSISIADELRVLDDYIELEKIRYDSRLTVSFYREIDNEQQAVSPLLLLPFVENAFKHGPGDSHLESAIHIDLVLQAGALTFTIENTREPAPDGQLREGIGLQNVKRQLELLYPDHVLDISDGDNLFSVTLHINLNVHEKDPLPFARG